MTRKITKIRNKIKEAEDGLRKIEIWKIWQKKFLSAKTYPPKVEKNYVSRQNKELTLLKPEDYI